MKKYSSYLLLPNNSKTCDLKQQSFISLSNLQLVSAETASLCSMRHQLEQASRALAGPLTRGLLHTAERWVLALSPELSRACGLRATVPFHMGLSIGSSEAALLLAPQDMVPGFQQNKADVHIYDLDPDVFLVLHLIDRGRAVGKGHRFRLLLESGKALEDIG